MSQFLYSCSVQQPTGMPLLLQRDKLQAEDQVQLMVILMALILAATIHLHSSIHLHSFIHLHNSIHLHSFRKLNYHHKVNSFTKLALLLVVGRFQDIHLLVKRVLELEFATCLDNQS